MKCTAEGCGSTDLAVCATLYLHTGTGADGTHTVGIDNIPLDEIDLACRACGNPVHDDESATYAETTRRLITGLLHNGAHTAGRDRHGPGTDAGVCASCGRPLIWDRTGARAHDTWGEYLCPVTHKAHQTARGDA
ncbi:hypothetical protein IAG44_40040 [Streptomyces roseirectus]|uniref:Uncharacterized protein n=1 Tax=Streptomyces roseirectus TaxID=2768066 RepID=A0A7H0IQD5_9ACTN|nr:hypothetical protein [Streptomyces roseirectus]QNP75001.1 hypothetical protein IAG44_40040 [Streptomyces roseirectus]